jgi:hypothetical protein
MKWAFWARRACSNFVFFLLLLRDPFLSLFLRSVTLTLVELKMENLKHKLMSCDVHL